MSNIFPETAGGGVQVMDPAGVVDTAALSTVVNGYTPPPSFHMACPVTYYAGRTCDMRFQPYQINAIESELLALAAAMDPTGTWSCGRVTNLAAAYQNALANLPETVTSLTYDPVAKYLHFTDEAGAAHVLDLSGLAIDMNATGATYNAGTGVLTLTGDDGMSNVTVNLSALKAVNVTNSITGNGDGSALRFVNDQAAPGASMLYGTDAAGVKGWYAQPSGGGGLTAATMASTMAGTGVGALFQWEDTGFGSPARGVVGAGIGGNTVNWPGTGSLLCPGSVNGGQYTSLGRTTSGYLAVRTA